MKKKTDHRVSECIRPAEAARRAGVGHATIDYWVKCSGQIAAAWLADGSYLIPEKEFAAFLKKRK